MSNNNLAETDQNAENEITLNNSSSIFFLISKQWILVNGIRQQFTKNSLQTKVHFDEPEEKSIGVYP